MSDLKIEISDSKAAIYQKIQKAVNEAKGKLDGTEDNGEIEIPIAIGKIKGNYSIEEGLLTVKVTNKPFLVSNKMIKEALQGFLEQ